MNRQAWALFVMFIYFLIYIFSLTISMFVNRILDNGIKVLQRDVSIDT